jgi:hypothetical protein
VDPSADKRKTVHMKKLFICAVVVLAALLPGTKGLTVQTPWLSLSTVK